MHNRRHAASERLIRFQPRNQFIFVDVVGDRKVGDIAKFVTVAEIVNDDNIVARVFHQHTNQVAPDESRAARYDVHAVRPFRVLRESRR
jgi:hypothetical protein